MSPRIPLPPERRSWAQLIHQASRTQQKRFFQIIGADVHMLEHDWIWRLRREQFEPDGDWDVWYANAGRGWGKTLTGAVAVNERAVAGQSAEMALIAPTAADARDVMVEGPAGILATALPEHRPDYESSKRLVTWPNGAKAHLYSAEEPERLRGPQHDFGWLDEMATWKNLEYAWDMYTFGLRLSRHPQTLITTTPKPHPVLKGIRTDPKTIVVGGSTFDNTALPSKFLNKLLDKYEGTRLGRQELYAEDLDQAEGALWTREDLENTRVADYPSLTRLVVGLDPAVTKTATSDEVGIIVGGRGVDGHCYIFEDLSKKKTPKETAQTAINAFKLWEADRIVAEANNGGDWIETVLRQIEPNISYKKLHASRGKQARAEPVSMLYEQKRVHHVGGFPQLEDELCSWEPNTGAASPNRLDALVWVVTELMLKGQGSRILHVRA